MAEDMTQLGLGIDAIELGRADQRVHGGGALASGVGTGKQIVASADGHAAQGALCRWVIDLDPAVVAVQLQRWPQVQGVHDRRRRVGLA